MVGDDAASDGRWFLVITNVWWLKIIHNGSKTFLSFESIMSDPQSTIFGYQSTILSYHQPLLTIIHGRWPSSTNPKMIVNSCGAHTATLADSPPLGASAGDSTAFGTNEASEGSNHCQIAKFENSKFKYLYVNIYI